MGLAELTRLAALLRRLARFAPDAPPEPGIVERSGLRTPGGNPYDSCAPRDTERGVAVLLHGMTLQGSAEPHLRHFARSLAAVGMCCLAPGLGGLADCRWEPRDLDVVADAVQTAAAGGRGVALVGFSHGAALALTAATRPDVAAHLRFVLAFGACYSIHDLFREYRETWSRPPRDDGELDDSIYNRLALAWPHRDALGLDPAGTAALRDLLLRYCHAATLDEKRRFDATRLRGDELLALHERHADPAVLAALSPAGRLGNVACPVSLVHDRHDHVIPCAHSERIFAELRAGAGGERHRLLLTTLLVRRESFLLPPLGELVRTFATLAPLLTGDRDD